MAGGIGWLDNGIAMFNAIYNFVEADCLLRGNTFNKELLKVHQLCRQKNKKGPDRSTEGESLVTT